MFQDKGENMFGGEYKSKPKVSLGGKSKKVQTHR
jgi:hypothetical protein